TARRWPSLAPSSATRSWRARALAMRSCPSALVKRMGSVTASTSWRSTVRSGSGAAEAGSVRVSFPGVMGGVRGAVDDGTALDSGFLLPRRHLGVLQVGLHCFDDDAAPLGGWGWP